MTGHYTTVGIHVHDGEGAEVTVHEGKYGQLANVSLGAARIQGDPAVLAAFLRQAAAVLTDARRSFDGQVVTASFSIDATPTTAHVIFNDFIGTWDVVADGDMCIGSYDTEEEARAFAESVCEAA